MPEVEKMKKNKVYLFISNGNCSLWFPQEITLSITTLQTFHGVRREDRNTNRYFLNLFDSKALSRLFDVGLRCVNSYFSYSDSTEYIHMH